MSPKITIIDYGVGNTHSIANAIKFLGYQACLSSNEKVIRESDFIVLPGVGAYEIAMNKLKELNLIPLLNEQVLEKKKPILGICLGMQLMATSSDENGFHLGLNWIPGAFKKLQLPSGYRVPHVGWNNIKLTQNSQFFNSKNSELHFYFDHSYFFEGEKKYIVAECDYGISIPSAIQMDNIFGVQFHPEKSQISGLKLFRKFFTSTSNGIKNAE